MQAAPPTAASRSDSRERIPGPPFAVPFRKDCSSRREPSRAKSRQRATPSGCYESIPPRRTRSACCPPARVRAAWARKCRTPKDASPVPRHVASSARRGRRRGLLAVIPPLSVHRTVQQRRTEQHRKRHAMQQRVHTHLLDAQPAPTPRQDANAEFQAAGLAVASATAVAPAAHTSTSRHGRAAAGDWRQCCSGWAGDTTRCPPCRSRSLASSAIARRS